MEGRRDTGGLSRRGESRGARAAVGRSSCPQGLRLTSRPPEVRACGADTKRAVGSRSCPKGLRLTSRRANRCRPEGEAQRGRAGASQIKRWKPARSLRVCANPYRAKRARFCACLPQAEPLITRPQGRTAATDVCGRGRSLILKAA